MKRGTFTTLTVGTTDGVIAGANAKRRALTVGQVIGGAMMIAFGVKATTTKGILINTNQTTFTFDYDNVGDLITQDIHAIGFTVTVTATFCTVEDAGAVP